MSKASAARERRATRTAERHLGYITCLERTITQLEQSLERSPDRDGAGPRSRMLAGQQAKLIEALAQ